MSVPPALPSLAILALSQDPGIPARLPLDPGVGLYQTPLSALEQRWGPGIPTGRPDQRDWRQSWFGVADLAAGYRFTPDGRLQGITLRLSLPPDERDRPDGPARQQAATSLGARCAELTANLFQDLGKPEQGGRSPQYLQSNTYQMWRREGVLFSLEDYAPGIDLSISRPPMLAWQTVAITGGGALARITLRTLHEDCSGGESELVLDASAAHVVADRLDEACATRRGIAIAVPPDQVQITIDAGAPQQTIVLRNLRDPAAAAGGAYGLAGMSVDSARALAAALRAPAPPHAVAGEAPALVGQALALLAERLAKPLLNGYARQFLGAIATQLLAVQQLLAAGTRPDLGQLAALTRSIAAARTDGRLDPPLSAVLFELARAFAR
jgi:hypothetical protein